MIRTRKQVKSRARSAPPDGIDAETLATAERAAKELLAEEEARPLVVSVLGQTGVGKSSLINALFNTNLETGRCGPPPKSRKTSRHRATGAR